MIILAYGQRSGLAQRVNLKDLFTAQEVPGLENVAKVQFVLSGDRFDEAGGLTALRSRSLMGPYGQDIQLSDDTCAVGFAFEMQVALDSFLHNSGRSPGAEALLKEQHVYRVWEGSLRGQPRIPRTPPGSLAAPQLLQKGRYRILLGYVPRAVLSHCRAIVEPLSNLSRGREWAKQLNAGSNRRGKSKSNRGSERVRYLCRFVRFGSDGKEIVNHKNVSSNMKAPGQESSVVMYLIWQRTKDEPGESTVPPITEL